MPSQPIRTEWDPIEIDTPKRIYGWLNTQLSTVRFWGEFKYNGKRYVIDFDDKDQPLVRWDVYEREHGGPHKAEKAFQKSIRMEAE